ncbi:dihydroxyacetone kinase subunit DhaL [Pediococcus claussenii]|uniref:phosphoenolpyruvate--glycerone phosphotransferase n=1 Tax=Pediococcus claussenii (strain ATCC BAA-344 / DSM 14800 / JCM 18046 / KCTC 3811 / LMG 21948 / P06) TaxID=701521 RepID=G8PBG1_PEDCP|nr:dihydroxyacetone kinase subunit DhaL [Pediococcus claussenii]AEV95950.1 PTS-dependent dihydroxyacetone kinase, ADP-binding subunit DhaL [Pediococcus claussenii ATCC BAA-344]ANZ69439.1 dihydroxyacetone kinase subunit L [Pediococcus claussenii]ANZ71259.1 dihydroxyacetone kinase subunit L [Pediococcus claussenii]KRN20557.1 dhaL protein [Pediococcus claussenii]
MTLDVEKTIKWMDDFNAEIQAQKGYLSELDTPIGDGDHGNNMARGMEAVHEALDGKEFNSVSDVLKTIAMSLISKVGGAAGPLYGTAFLEMSKTNSGDIKDLIPAGLAGIERRGNATEGEKTMVDVWKPAAEAVSAGKLTSKLIDESVEKTRDMQATKGRASYVGERSIGHIDPGSMSSGYLLKTLLKVGE